LRIHCAPVVAGVTFIGGTAAYVGLWGPDRGARIMGPDYGGRNIVAKIDTELTQLARLFLRLGTIGFGGPAAHLALMEEEVVVKRKWVSHQRFLDLLGVTNLIPGPNSTEMAIHLGYERAGWRGLIVAGACFVLPATLITGLLAWGYVRYGGLPQVLPLFAGIKPVVVAIICGALWRLGKSSVKDWRLGLIGIGVGAMVYKEGHPVLILLAGAVVGMLWVYCKGAGSAVSAWWGAVVAGGYWKRAEAQSLRALESLDAGDAVRTGAAVAVTSAAAAVGTTTGGVALWQLGLFFLKVGAVLYGSGYVLFAFLEGGLVHDLGLLTHVQLMDAVAVGQFTPGPVLSTATFIGYLIAGPAGAVVATVGIFLPSFIFVAAVNPVIAKLRSSRLMSAFLDAVNVSAVGLMGAMLVRLAQSALVDSFSWWMAGAALLVMVSQRISPVWLIIAGGITGYAAGMG
jgi:chromate transporter